MPTKAEARQTVHGMKLPIEQTNLALRAIRRATASENIDIISTGTEDVMVRRSRPGRSGHQAIETNIRPDGSHDVVQLAYDATGNLIHHDPKGGKP